jgi:hypothetical protein
VCTRENRYVIHSLWRQTFDRDDFGVSFCDMCFWQTNAYALGEQTNGASYVGGMFSGFASSVEGPCALSNGERDGFVYTAFQVLLVKPIEGL